MSVNVAKNHFLGKDGYQRMNCAQSVLNAFKETFDLTDETVESFKAYGSGKAPEGLCGAFYAAKYVIEHADEREKTDILERYFTEQAGALQCRQIRECKKLSCLGCVEKSSEFLVKWQG